MKKKESRIPKIFLTGAFISTNLFFSGGCAGSVFFPEIDDYSKKNPQIFITLNGDDYFSMEEKTNHLFWALIRRIEEAENRNLTRKELSIILKDLDLKDGNNDGKIEVEYMEKTYMNILKNMNENNSFKKYLDLPENYSHVELGPNKGLSP